MYLFVKNKRRIMAVFLTVCMVLTLIPATAFAGTSSTDVWDGNIDTSWYNTTDREFTISTSAQLAGLAAIVNSSAAGIARDLFEEKTITLAVDLDLGGVESSGSWSGSVWKPIGRSSTKFQGTFDGNGHKISNLYIDKDGTNTLTVQGLFGNIGNSGKVKNLHITSGYIEARATIGAIAGTSAGVVLNCSSDVTIVGNDSRTSTGVSLNVGGLIGKSEKGVIANSFCSGDVTANKRNVGGITGYNSGGKIVDCYYSGNLTMASDTLEGVSDINYGMIAGIMDNITSNGVTYSGIIENVYSRGSLTGVTSDKTYYGTICGNAGAASSGVTRAYYLKTDSINNGYYGIGSDTAVTSDASGTASKNTEELKSLAEELGDSFQSDTNNINSGYPVLAWQNTGVYQDEMDGLDIAGLVVGSSKEVASGFSVTMNKLLGYSTPQINQDDFTITATVDGEKVELENLYITVSSGDTATMVKFSFSTLKVDTDIQYKVRYKQGTEVASEIVKSDSDYWIDYFASGFAGGTGTAEDPYQIATPQQFAYMAKYSSANNQFAGKYIVLTQDIDFDGKKWVPSAFSGFFDGQGHSILNMVCEGTLPGSAAYSGLFSTVEPLETSAYKVAYLANIRIIEPKVSFIREAVTCSIGALAGKVKDTNVINCSVEGGTVDGEAPGNTLVYIGGLFGQIGCSSTMESMYLRSCSSTAEVTGGDYAGGLTGQLDSGSSYGTMYLEDCWSGGSVSGKLAGGIIGDIMRIEGLEIEHCFSTAIVQSTDSYAGGLVGHVSLTGSNNQYIGEDGLTISDSVAFNPSISSPDSTKVGRLVGNGAELDTKGHLSGNYGWELTKINGDMIVGSELEGSNFNVETAASKAFWSDELGFDFSDSGRWIWTDSDTPQLKAEAISGIYELSLVSQPSDASAYDNKSAVFAVAVTGGSKGYTYQWQYSTGQNEWKEISDGTGIIGAAEKLLTLGADASYSSGILVRCIISDNTGHNITSESAEFTKKSGEYTIEEAKDKVLDYYKDKGMLTQAREAFSLLTLTEDVSGFNANLPFYYTYGDSTKTDIMTGYFYWLMMDCYAMGVDPHDYAVTEKMHAIAATLNLQNKDTGGFVKYYAAEYTGAGIPSIILSLEMYFDGRNWGNERDGTSLGRDGAIQYFFSQITEYAEGGKIYGEIKSGDSDTKIVNQGISSLRAQAEAVILLARLSDDEVYGAQAKEAMNDILTAMKKLYSDDKITYTENMALYVSALTAAAKVDSAKSEEYTALAGTIITEKIFKSEAFDGGYGRKVGVQNISGDADATAAVMMALGDYCNGTSLLADYVFDIPDKNAVENDLNEVIIPYNITEDITLPTAGRFGSTFTWTTSNADCITIDGKVTRGTEDVVVALNAMVVNGSATITKKFIVVVKADMDADSYAVNTALSEADVIFETIRGNITIPDSTVEGVTFSWSSSNSDVLTADGKVTRPAIGQEDAQVTLTLTATKENVTKTKDFKVMVYSKEDTSKNEGQIKEAYYLSRDYYLYNRTLQGYWNVWAAYSALGDYIQDPDNGYVYDTTGNSDEQSGAHILAVIAMGENPYDYGGTNLVKALLNKGLGGAYSVPVYNALALDAAGIYSEADISVAINGSIGQMKALSYGPDIGGWAAVVASRHLKDEKYKEAISEAIEYYKTTLAADMASGSMGSKGLSYGCVVTGFTALTAAGLDGFNVTTDSPWAEQNPIQLMYNNYVGGEQGVDSKWNVQYIMEFSDLYNTLYNNGNVGWITCGVSKDKLEAQKAKAQEILNNNYQYEESSLTDIKAALTLVNSISEDRLDAEVADYGEEYYALYDAVRYAQLSGEDSDADIAKEVNDYIMALPSVSDLKLSDEASVAMARNAFDALTVRQKSLVSDEAEAKLKALEAQLIVLKRLGIEISGGYSDAYVLTVEAIQQGDERYTAVQNKIKEALEKIAAGQSVDGLTDEIAKILKVGQLLALYDLSIYDSWLDEQVEVLEDGLKFSIPIPEGGYDSYLIVHMKSDGTLEYIIPEIVDGKLVFSLSSLSPVGVIGYNAEEAKNADIQPNPQDTVKAAAATGDNSMTEMYAFLSIAALLALSAGYVVRRKRIQRSN